MLFKCIGFGCLYCPSEELVRQVCADEYPSENDEEYCVSGDVHVLWFSVRFFMVDGYSIVLSDSVLYIITTIIRLDCMGITLIF